MAVALYLSCSSLVSHRCLSTNILSFHEHNGKPIVTICLFINIMERPVSDIFPPFVFNNIMEDTFIFSPRVFSLPCRQKPTNQLIFNDIAFWKISAVFS